MKVLSSLKRLTFKLLKPSLIGVILTAAIGASSLTLNNSRALAEERVNPALWKLSDEDSEIWLFGNLHFLPKGLVWRTEKFNRAFESSDTFYMEAPVIDPPIEVMGPLLKKHAYSQSGKSFFDELSPEGRNNFINVLRSLGISNETAANFAPMRPWFAAVNLAIIQIKAYGLDPLSGVDGVLWREAKSKNKKLGYFETIDQQFSIFSHFSPEDDLEYFEASMAELLEETTLLKDMLNFWKSGNIDGLSGILTSATEENDKMNAILFTDRNKDWAQQIDQLMRGSGKIFIAVGAGHLGGDKSVQHFLEQMGYEVERQ